MSRFRFCGFMDYDGGKIARVTTTGAYEIPLNVSIDNADKYDTEENAYADDCFDEPKGTPCSIDVWGTSRMFQVFDSEEEYLKERSKMPVRSLIPLGTFAVSPHTNTCRQNPGILFSGKVQSIVRDKETEGSVPRYFVLVEALELTFWLYLSYAGKIEKGSVIEGAAQLYGNLVMPMEKEKEEREAC